MVTSTSFPKGAGSGVPGEYVRIESVFRDWISADPAASFPAEPGRYHLYISHACPWAHRTEIVRRIKGLADVISLSAVSPLRDDRGWAFAVEDGVSSDPVNGFAYLAEAYVASDTDYAGRVSVPVLWDRESGRIVNNESSEIIQMLNSEFDAWGDSSVDLYPSELKDEIDEINDLVYTNVNNGVYRCGFAKSQEAYERAAVRLFETLDLLDARLSTQRYLVGDQPTLADWRLFTTLVRFDAVYVGHFKCNLRRIADYANLSGYLRDLYSAPDVAATFDLDQIKRHYYMSHSSLNPLGIVPVGPDLGLTAPHDRTRITNPSTPG
jgi:putative glutathione S-transferase